MNFLAHLRLADRAGLPLAGAVLGDAVRGRLAGRFPPPLERSIALHRRIDVLTDTHPLVAAARARFAAGRRRHAGILLDLLWDHCLALDWPDADEPLAAFCSRAAQSVDDDEAWRSGIGRPAPAAPRFAALLRSYGTGEGIDRAIEAVAARMKQPSPLLDAASGWRSHLPSLRAVQPQLMADLERAATAFAVSG